MLPFISFIVVVRQLFICVAGHLNNRLPLNICSPQLLFPPHRVRENSWIGIAESFCRLKYFFFFACRCTCRVWSLPSLLAKMFYSSDEHYLGLIKLTVSYRRCWTRLAKRAGRNFRSSSFSSDRRRTNIPASWWGCGNSIGGSLAFDGERILEWHSLTKYFASRRKAVYVFCSIHKAAIFNAE